MFLVLLIILQIVLSVDCKIEGEDVDDCLRIANELRKLHSNTGLMVWNTDLANEAQAWAEHLISIDGFEHATNLGGVGENLYKMTSQRAAKCADAQLAWYKEFDNYDYATHKSKNSEVIGHFTQVVWRSSTHLGMGLASKLNVDLGYIETVIVARYNPGGNVFGQFSDNVAKRKDGASTPSVYQLDPKLCVNNDSQCKLYKQYGYCHVVKNICAKECNTECNT